MSRGTVQSISDKRKFDVIKIDGVEYSNWNCRNIANEGDVVEFEMKESGEYKNIKSIEVVKKGTGPPKDTGDGEDRRNKGLIRAIEYCDLLIKSKPRDIPIETVIEYAMKFSIFIMGRDPRKESKEQPTKHDTLLGVFDAKCKSEMVDRSGFERFLSSQHNLDVGASAENTQTVLDNWEKYHGEYRMMKSKKEDDIPEY